MLSWAMFVVVVVWLAPMQHDLYLSHDVWLFRVGSFQRAMIIAAATIITVLLALAIKYRKPLVRALSWWLYASFCTICLLFIFHQVLLASALFVNKVYVRESGNRAFVARYSLSTNGKHLFFSDLKGHHIDVDSKMHDVLSRAHVAGNDTVHATCATGLLGIPFYPDLKSTTIK